MLKELQGCVVLCANCHRNDAHELRRVLAVVPERPYGDVRFDHDQHLRMKGIVPPSSDPRKD